MITLFLPPTNRIRFFSFFFFGRVRQSRKTQKMFIRTYIVIPAIGVGEFPTNGFQQIRIHALEILCVNVNRIIRFIDQMRIEIVNELRDACSVLDFVYDSR